MLYVGALEVVAEVDEHLRPLAELLAHGECRAPVGEVGVVEGWLEGLVLQQHAHTSGHRPVGFGEALEHAVAPLYEGVLAGVVGAVGEPQGEDVRAHLAADLDALDEVLCGLAPHRGVRVADASEPVVLFLKEVWVYGPDPQPQRARVLLQLPVVIDPVPGDVDGYRRTYARVAVNLGGVRELLERVARHTRLREDFEAGAGVAVAPRRGFHPLGAQALFHARHVHPAIREKLGQDVVGPLVRALQNPTFLLTGTSRCTRNTDDAPSLCSSARLQRFVRFDAPCSAG